LNEENLLEELQKGLLDSGLAPESYPCDTYLQYIYLLDKWNRSYNLTAIRDKGRMIYTHILDSLSVMPYIKGNDCLDVGTGAGLPGLVLALAQPQQKWVLLDSNGKKTRFLNHLHMALKIKNIKIAQSRVEDYIPPGPFTTIISRALGSLSAYCRDTGHLLQPGIRLLAMKGEISDEEMQAVAHLQDHIVVQELSVLGIDGQRNIVILDL